jgi:hypothetical protein
MKLSFWVDVFPWTDPSSVLVTQFPLIQKPEGAIRYRIDVEIPNWHAEDSVVQGEAKKEG